MSHTTFYENRSHLSTNDGEPQKRRGGSNKLDCSLDQKGESIFPTKRLETE